MALQDVRRRQINQEKPKHIEGDSINKHDYSQNANFSHYREKTDTQDSDCVDEDLQLLSKLQLLSDKEKTLKPKPLLRMSSQRQIFEKPNENNNKTSSQYNQFSESILTRHQRVWQIGFLFQFIKQ